MSSNRTRPFDLKSSSRDFTLKAQVYSRVNEFYDKVRGLFGEVNGHVGQLFKEKDLMLKHKNISVHREEAAIRLRFEKTKEKELKECYMMLQQKLQDLLTVYSLILSQQSDATASSSPPSAKADAIDPNSQETIMQVEKDERRAFQIKSRESSPHSPRSKQRYDTPTKTSNDCWNLSYNASRTRDEEGCQTQRHSHRSGSWKPPRGSLSYGCV